MAFISSLTDTAVSLDPIGTIGNPLHTSGRGGSGISVTKQEDVPVSVEEEWKNDPDNPRNWTSGQKWVTTGVAALYTFVSPLGSSIMAPGLPEIAVNYAITNETIIAMTLSIFLLSFAIGPLFLAPLSEMYGRKWVLHLGNLLTVALTLGCAFAPTADSFLAFRFLVGFSASAPVACGGGLITDLFSEHDRAAAMAIYSLGPLLGPVFGPIAGGFITERIGIKYVFIVVAALAGLASVIGIPFLRETYAPIVRLNKAKKSLDSEMMIYLRPVLTGEQPSRLHTMWINLSRPLIILSTSLVCFVLSLYMAFIYGIYYLMFATFSDLFSSTYGFSIGIGGLAFIPLGLGFLLATFFSTKVGNLLYHYLSNKNGGKSEPEMRIPALIFSSVSIPVGLFWYGWSADAKLHWIMPMIGSGIFGFGMTSAFLPIQLYIVDTFTHSASAISGASVFRSLLGFGFPLFGHQMFEALGTGGGNSLLAGLAIILGIPFPIYLYYHGAEMRAKGNLTR